MKNKGVLSRVLSLIKPYSVYVALSIVGSILTVAASLYIPYVTGQIIDNMVKEGKVLCDGVIKGACVIAAAAAVSALSQYISSVCNNRIVYRTVRDIRNRLSEKLQRLPLSFLDSHPSGDLLSRMISDTESFTEGLLMGFTQFFTGVITIGATLVIMLVLNPLIALSVLFLTPLSLFVAKFISGRTHKYFVKQAEVRGKETTLINELVSGAEEVKGFGQEEEALSEFEKVNEELRRVSLNATFFSSLVNPGTRLVNNIVYAVVALISGFAALKGVLSVGQISVFLSYAGQYAKPFNEISSVVTEMQNALTCASRVFELLEETEEVPDTSAPLDPEAKGEVKLDSVYFSYTGNKPLIENMCLDVKSGQTVAIVGPTGCGKTTIINLLMRFYDVNKGSIKTDGVNIKDLTRHNLRSRYAMVLQDTWLFGGTVRDNISYGKPDATDEEIIAAAKNAHAHSFIRRLPDGYDTVIADGGSNLSAGQRQLLCIARVMLCLPYMLILDEATSSIDTRTEMKIQSAFSEMMKGRTSFVVAHRLSTVRNADVILVMRDGKIIEQGTHEKLMSEKGFYEKLYKSQFEVI